MTLLLIIFNLQQNIFIPWNTSKSYEEFRLGDFPNDSTNSSEITSRSCCTVKAVWETSFEVRKMRIPWSDVSTNLGITKDSTSIALVTVSIKQNKAKKTFQLLMTYCFGKIVNEILGLWKWGIFTVLFWVECWIFMNEYLFISSYQSIRNGHVYGTKQYLHNFIII